MDSTAHCASFVEPSKIRVLVVPIGKWTRKEFLGAIGKLEKYNEIRLLDITPIDSSLFTPQGFPNGRLFFKFITSGYSDSLHLFLYDFEPFRKIFVVIGLVNDDSDPESNLLTLKEKYPTIISHNLIVTSKISPPSEIDNIFSCQLEIDGNLETILCDIGKNFLKALNHYYSSYKHVTLRSPGAIGGNSVLKTCLTRQIVGLTAVLSSSTSNASKRLSSIEITTNNIKRSASLKLAKSLSTTENRSQHRSRGRQLKILGNFQLLAGRYTDALTSFGEAIGLLHKVRDHLWLGSALDGIAICFVLLSYLQMPFQIPQIINVLCPIETFNTSVENGSPRNSVSYTPMKSPRDSSSSLSSALAIDAETVDLPKLIKSISEKIMYYYELSLSHTCDYCPQIVYSEILLKTLSFMVACHRGAELTSVDLKNIIHGTLTAFSSDEEVNPGPIFSKMEIYSFANRIFDLQLKDMDVESQSEIYVTLARVYGSLGFERKRAFVLRLLLVALVSNPEHIQSHLGYEKHLEDMVKLYGIEDRAPERSVVDSGENSWLTLQKKCLQLCLTASSRVNDNESVAHYAMLLISRYTHLLTQSEQQTLFSSYIQPLILEGYIKTYWDPFLLRDLKFARLESDGLAGAEEIPIESKMASHENQEGEDFKVDTSEVFNPFKALQATSTSRNNDSTAVKGVFLVGDKAMISCMVQNPFKFEIGITGIQFNAETLKYCELDGNDISLKQPAFVSGESIRLINLAVKFKKPTYHKWHTITSLKLSILGLPSEEFNIICSESKIANGGIENDRCNVESVQIKILPEQPELQLLRTENMAENSWMMLHGTKRKVSVILRNKSLTRPIDYLQFSHLTSVEKSIKSDYWKKLPLDDLYGMERQLEWLKTTCIKVIDPPSQIRPNETVSIEVEIDTTSVPLQFSGFDLITNYGMQAEDGSCVYLKKLILPYEVSLRRSLEIPNMEIIPLNELFDSKMESVDWIEFVMRKKRSDKAFRISDYALLLLDIRNSWIDGIRIGVSFEDFLSEEYLIEADHTTRVIVPFKKLGHETVNLKNKNIPRVFQGRQYIQSGLLEEQEFDMREKFWCKEHILTRLKCQWHLLADPTTTGLVDFRQFLDKFDQTMVTTMYANKSPYHVELTMDRKSVPKGQRVRAKVVITPTQTKHTGVEQSMLHLSFLIFDNRTSKLLPKSNRRILYNGNLTRHIMATKKAETTLDLLPIERGDYEVCARITRPDDADSMIQFNTVPVTFLVE